MWPWAKCLCSRVSWPKMLEVHAAPPTGSFTGASTPAQASSKPGKSRHQERNRCIGQPQAVASIAWRYGYADGAVLILTAATFHCSAELGVNVWLELMNADERNIRVRPENLFCPLPMMDLPVEDHNALHEIRCNCESGEGLFAYQFEKLFARCQTEAVLVLPAHRWPLPVSLLLHGSATTHKWRLLRR